MSTEQIVEPLMLKAGSTLWRGPHDDSEYIILEKEFEVEIAGYDYHNNCFILEADFLGKDKPERFYLPDSTAYRGTNEIPVDKSYFLLPYIFTDCAHGEEVVFKLKVVGAETFDDEGFEDVNYVVHFLDPQLSTETRADVTAKRVDVIADQMVNGFCLKNCPIQCVIKAQARRE